MACMRFLILHKQNRKEPNKTSLSEPTGSIYVVIVRSPTTYSHGNQMNAHYYNISKG